MQSELLDDGHKTAQAGYGLNGLLINEAAAWRRSAYVIKQKKGRIEREYG